MKLTFSQFISTQTFESIPSNPHFQELYSNNPIYLYHYNYAIQLNPNNTYSLALSNKLITSKSLINLQQQLYTFYIQNS